MSRSWSERALDILPPPIGWFFRRAHEEDILFHAAGLAFYALVSAAPLAIFVLWIVSAVLGDDRVRFLAEQLQQRFPAGLGGGDALRRVAELGSQVGFVALLAALWPATAYGAGLSRAFDRLSPQDTELRALRGRGLLLVGLLPLFVFGALLAAIFGTTLLSDGPLRGASGWVLGLVFAFVGAGVVVAAIFMVFGPTRPRWRRALRGTLIASVAISVLTIGFTVYLQVGADFQSRYASSGLAGVVLFGVWLFLANAAVLVGYVYSVEGQ